MENLTAYVFRVLPLMVITLVLGTQVSSVSAKTCVVSASGSNTTDDAPAIVEAFEECGQGGTIVFSNTTYYVNSVMNINGIEDALVDIQGTLLWSTDISYWLNNSLPVGYQNQSTAFILSGNNVTINGGGVGTLNGNGQSWYTFIGEQSDTSNYPGRPHAITLSGLNNSQITGVNFLQSQMWTMSIIYSHNVTLDSIYVNNLVESGSASNTDGADTIRSSNITFDNWTVYNGDDSIALKGNSTDITIRNSQFYDGLGIAIGSIGQYDGVYEVIQGLTVDNITYSDTLHAFYFKTWTGTQVGYPPNGGGGGIADVSNMNVTSLYASSLRGAAVAISQCTTFSGGGTPANCTNSEVQIHDITVQGLSGTSESDDVASLQCSAVKPCYDIAIEDITLTLAGGTEATEYLCSEVESNTGFNCTGSACVGSSATGEC
ncbi:family 28 glycoside hydrolase [Cryphonectria parasitica EP155]|uniref:Family 28 glycoside hydrolase n=1 Tax=Cryphonectria parasitica (strain ATCC 38755 / EP155) TaxID=660469 RepID=A0A9P4XV08_CRYP1|nr:family 28 glycoside hydrolase [Cryphonectria parasitica EP155]KAF3761416.1 family 28 glycoside hydrolase [Cryphonectria parasitica EP155]